MPFSLVVKKGMNRFFSSAAGMPTPVSRKRTSTMRPVRAAPRAVRSAGRDGELAARGHGLDGVEGEVQEHLAELLGVGAHARQLVGERVISTCRAARPLAMEQLQRSCAPRR